MHVRIYNYGAIIMGEMSRGRGPLLYGTFGRQPSVIFR